MSAHCSTCGSDLVYPVGTWPLGTCQVCDLRAQLRERDVLLADAKDALTHMNESCGDDDCTYCNPDLSALAQVQTLVDAANAFTQALADEWVREADPSHPDEVAPPWQQPLLEEVFSALAPFRLEAHTGDKP